MLFHCLSFYLTTCSDDCYRNNTPDKKKFSILIINKNEIGIRKVMS